jgi:hypothetical protein
VAVVLRASSAILSRSVVRTNEVKNRYSKPARIVLAKNLQSSSPPGGNGLLPPARGDSFNWFLQTNLSFAGSGGGVIKANSATLFRSVVCTNEAKTGAANRPGLFCEKLVNIVTPTWQ